MSKKINDRYELIKYCNTLTLKTKTLYRSIGKVFCVVLQKEVIFNSRGFHHLRYKSDGTPRNINERIYKLRLFPLAVAVIKNASSINEERRVFMVNKRKKYQKKILAKQLSLVATVGNKKPIPVRVIVIKFEKSNKVIFWSIMKN